MSSTRQLAAILFTDIAGYTAMMQRDEKSAVTMVKHHRSVLEKTVTEFNGDVIEFYGDGSLCIFTSITEAVQCAYNIQQQMQQSDPVVPLRIGLHIGEVIYEDGKIMGDGVNIAARIQSLGQPGSILFSKEVYDKIRNHDEFKTVYLGRYSLKNVSEPMDVSALSNEGLTVPAKEKIEGRIIEITTRKKLKALRKWILISTAAIVITLLILFLPGLLKDKMGFTGSEKSIAVLPFENISNDTLQQYFADGITEEIISRLSKIADLKVISRTSVMQYKNTTKNIKLIADELGVAAILEGSVRKDGNKIRITAQLIDANTDKHIWTNTYDENSSEIFTIQSKVAQNIVNELNVKLTTEENKRLTDKATNNVEAYEEFLRAKKLPWTKRIDTLNSVLKKDSTFSLAWAELAATYTKIPYRTQSDKPYYIRKSLDAAFNAVNYGNDRSETHMILGDVLKTITLNPAISINELNKSISLNPNNAEAYVYLAFAQMELGRFAEAEKNLKKARSLDPLSGLMSIGWVTYYRYSRQPEKLLTLKNDIRIENFSTYMDSTLKQWYFFLKDEFDSLLTYKTMGLSTTVMGIAYIRTGQTNNAQHIIDSLVSVSEYDHAFPVGILYAWMGEKQKALDYLNLAYRLYDYGLISIKVDKLFDPLRNEEGFKELLRKMGME